MNQVKFTLPPSANNYTDDPKIINNGTFFPTSMDASIYFIQQYTKLIYDNFAAASSRAIDEGFAEKERKNSSAANEHRFIIFTFDGVDQLQLRHTWKDSYSILHEELKNISYENRQSFSDSNMTPESIESISGQFEEIFEKFEVSYFNCSHLTSGNFVLKESENVFVFCLSSQRYKLKVFHEKLRIGWQRKNVFIHLHPDSYKEYCENSISGFNYFPVTNLRDSDQLARSLCHANIFNSFETPNMELLGKGGLAEFVIATPTVSSNHYTYTSSIGLLKPNFVGKPKWPIPNTLTEDSWSDTKPKLFVQNFFDHKFALKHIQFDEYITYCPDVYQHSKEESKLNYFVISVMCELGKITIGYGELIEPSSFTNGTSVPLFKVFIGPFNFPKFTSVMQGFEPFSKYLQNIPQFYEYYLHSNLGEYKWNELCKQSGSKSSTWRNEFPLPNGLVTSKNYFKTFWRQKCKNDLVLLVERADNSHRLRTVRRQSSYHPKVFPSLSQLKNDSNHLERLIFRFKNSLQIFLASSDSKMGNSHEFNQFQLSQVLFKHCLSVNQMTDFSEAMQKKRSLRPLFNENERDLFNILKEMPCLAEEMASAQFVCGDIFGNPYKKERKTREPSKMAQKRAASFNRHVPIIEEVDDLSSSSDDETHDRILSPMSIDEIDFKEMEDIESEILLNGSITNLPQPSKPASSIIYDLSTIQKWIKSPGGLDAKTKLIEFLPVIDDTEDLKNLLDLSRRFKRIKMTEMILERIEAVNK